MNNQKKSPIAIVCLSPNLGGLELDAIKYALSGDKDMSVQILKKIIESDETSNEVKIRSEKFLEIIK